VVDPRWVKPVNPALVALARSHRAVVTVEDNGRVGGVGAAITQTLQDGGVNVPVRVVGIPQRFLDHAKRAQILERLGLTGAGVADAARSALG
jgi:1-deoxy-D-xylulose-5-phosphate synthase